jgi:transcriptional regulator with XRE-family HTH domain
VRHNLKLARNKTGMTQQQVADSLSISLVYYQKIEQGSRTGEYKIWDKLEDLFRTSQRILRENL